jgi:hypothetical protein
MDDIAKMSYNISLVQILLGTELTPKPTLVAIDELQLHDLHIAEAAVPPIKSALSHPPCSYRIANLPMKTVHPVHSVLPREPRPPASTGIDSNAPIVNGS